MRPTREMPVIPSGANLGYMLDSYTDGDRLYLTFDLLQQLTTEAFDRALAFTATGGGPLRVLDLGCGEGLHLADALTRHPGFTGVGIDRDAEAIGTAGAAFRELQRAHFHCADVCEPISPVLADGVSGRDFDVAYAIHSFQHFHDAKRALRSAHEVIRPGGVLWLFDMVDHRVQLPHPSFEALSRGLLRVFEHFGTPRAADRHVELLADAGFTICETRVVEHPFGGAEAAGRTALMIFLLALRAARRAFVDTLRLMSDEEFESHLARLSAEVTPEMVGVLPERITIARKE